MGLDRMKLSNRMKTINLARTVQAPARYGLFIQRGDNEVFTPMPVEMDNPIKQLRRIVEVFELIDSFQNVTSIKCMDIDNGGEQWELIIK